MIKQNIIIFPGGCYGTFFEWIFNWLENPSIQMPFLDNGSSHGFRGNFFWPKEKLFEHISLNRKNRFSRIHDGLFTNDHVSNQEYQKNLGQDLDFLSKHFDKILVLSCDHDSMLWRQGNQFDKSSMSDEYWTLHLKPYGYSKEIFEPYGIKDPTQRMKRLIELELEKKSSSFKIANLMGWNKSNINDFDIWEIRELLSFYWFERITGEITAWHENKRPHDSNIVFLTLTDIKNNFVNSVVESARHFDLDVNDETKVSLQQIYEKWFSLQKHINKDTICKQIVESLLYLRDFDWSNHSLSIVDEAWIQKTLRDNGVEIRCHNLNVFPTKSQDFIPLLELKQ